MAGGRIWNHQHLSQVDRVISNSVQTERCSWQFQVRSCYPDIWCASGISSRTNTLHPIYMSLGQDMYETQYCVPSLCWWPTKLPYPSNHVSKVVMNSVSRDWRTALLEWMTLNLLKLNDDKTEFILFGTRQQLSKLNTIPVLIAIGDTTVHPVEMVRNLGYIMDKLLKNTAHINKTVSTTYCQIRNIQKIRSKLDIESTHTVVQALVPSRLDYCNSMLHGSADYQLHKLQKSKIWPQGGVQS